MPIAHPFTERDLKQLRNRGIPAERAAGYLATLAEGMPYVVLDRPCARGDGITVLDEGELERLCRRGDEAAGAGRFSKFVPASGAATRMFQPLLAARNRAADESETVEDLRDLPEYPALREFMARLERFAFHPDLGAALERQGKRLQPLRDAGRFREVLECLLDPGGLGYAGLPKGLILFHRYPDDCRTPVAEHLVNARAHVRDRDGTARVHFTVSPEHRAAVEGHVAALRRRYEDSDTRYDVTLSEQRPDTDTLAATLDNRPSREPDGGLSFRPGGHGALLANLNDLGGDVVFIQNIDNVAMDSGTAIRCRKALAGCLVDLQARVSITSTGSTPTRRRLSSTKCSGLHAPRCPWRRRKAWGARPRRSGCASCERSSTVRSGCAAWWRPAGIRAADPSGSGTPTARARSRSSSGPR